MAVSSTLGPLLACLGTFLLACSEEPNFVDDASSGGTGAASIGGSASGGAATGGSASGGADSGGATSGGDGPGGAPGGGGGDPNPTCGDGLVNTESEECDDGNQVDDDTCAGCVVNCEAGGYKDPVTFHCYFTRSQEPWDNARQDCIDTGPGTDAAALSTLEEYDAVVSHFFFQGKVTDHWIGAQRGPAVWSWTHGEPWTYLDGEPPWAGGFPGNSGNCARIKLTTMGREMKDDYCDESKPVICERIPAGT